MSSIKFRALTYGEQKSFFEAICEYGKDFNNINQHIALKSSKGAQDKKEEDKKREQIRNFYNKLYTKLSQLVKIDDRVEKVYQELYLLINYGEIWKKHGFIFNKKTKKLLEELVYQGYTTFRFKNKNVRLRTPTCKALKKINGIGIDEKEKVVTSRELPKEVIVEFHPATNRDWLKVQSLSQNPLVRARLSIQKRLTDILEFLEIKWNLSREKSDRIVDVWLKLPREEVPADQAPFRLRLKPSAQHELKEINITRVVPDNHLDLSLHAYIKRMGEPKNNSIIKSTSNHDVEIVPVKNCETSQGALSSSSHNLPLSLTTPDSSILFERSCTSDQPSFAHQARKHLNILQSLAGTFEECENSRTAQVSSIPFDEDAAIDTNLSAIPQTKHATEQPRGFAQTTVSQHDLDCHKSQSIGFDIPKNVTLGDFFKMDGQEDANDAFSTSQVVEANTDPVEKGEEPEPSVPSIAKPHNHMIEIQKLAEGWTRQDEPSITIGELYLAFRCPEKIVLEYGFEQFPCDNQDKSLQSNVSDGLIFKLLTAASLSLAHIERKNQDLQQNASAKLKRRKVQCQVRSLQDIEINNQRVEEELKKLRSSKLIFKRAR